MDLNALELRVKKKVSVLYHEKHPEPGVIVDVPDFDARMGRLRAFQRNLRGHREIMTARKKRADYVASQVAVLWELSRALADGKRIMAFDVERTLSEITQEVGVTTFRRGEGFRSFNFRVEGAPKRAMSFAFGNSDVMPWEEMKRRLMLEGEQSDFYVGHSIATDFEHLKSKGLRLPFRPIMDTFHASCLVEEREGGKLGELCEYLGVDASRPHGGGNDARYNMELALAMVDAYVS
jgi:hypothetical protein